MKNLKLSNIWGQWSNFWDAAEYDGHINMEDLKKYWDKNGFFKGEAKDAIGFLVWNFNDSWSFRQLFSGYTEADSQALVSSISTDADAGTNYEKVVSALYQSFLAFIKFKGKQLSDYSYSEHFGIGAESENPTSKFIGNKYWYAPTTFCSALYVKGAGEEPTIVECEDAVRVLGFYIEEERNDYSKDTFLYYKGIIYQYISDSEFYLMAENIESTFASIPEAEAYIDSNLAYEEQTIPGTSSVAPNRIAQQANKAGVIGSPTAQAVSVRNEPFTYEGPDGKLVEVVEVGGVLIPGQRCFEAHYRNGKSATFIFADNWALADSYDQNGEGLTDEYTIEAIQNKYNPKSKSTVDKRVEVLDRRGTTRSGKAVSEQIAEFAERKGCLDTVRKVAKWLNKLCGHGCGKGTAVGRNYSTLLINISYEDAAISIDTYSDNIKLKGQFCEDFKEFKSQFDKYYVVVKSLKKGNDLSTHGPKG